MKKVILLVLFIFSTGASATKCPSSDFNFKYKPKTPVEDAIYCYNDYVLSYDFGLKSALWVGEHLNPKKSYYKKRKNSFHAEPLIPEPSRTTPKDYREPLYDQGHLAPSGDMTSEHSQYESFAMSNMVPQLPELNRGIWKKLEDGLRETSHSKDLYIITGPVYNEPLTYIGNKVPVPEATFKWVYNKTDNIEFGYLIPNNTTQFDSLDNYKIGKQQLELKANIVFP